MTRTNRIILSLALACLVALAAYGASVVRVVWLEAHTLVIVPDVAALPPCNEQRSGWIRHYRVRAAGGRMSQLCLCTGTRWVGMIDEVPEIGLPVNPVTCKVH